MFADELRECARIGPGGGASIMRRTLTFSAAGGFSRGI
jgi:hypothetical protein